MINVGDTVEIIANYGVSDYDEYIGTTAKITVDIGNGWWALEGHYVEWETRELRKVEVQQ